MISRSSGEGIANGSPSEGGKTLKGARKGRAGDLQGHWTASAEMECEESLRGTGNYAGPRDLSGAGNAEY